MRIYIAHSREFDFREDLYEPIKESSFYDSHEIVLPHDNAIGSFGSKEFFKHGCDLVIAEVSYSSTGMGIELGWADVLNVPIVALYKKGTKVSSSVKEVTKNVFEYADKKELIAKIKEAIGK